jgi:hypothetical protein
LQVLWHALAHVGVALDLPWAFSLGLTAFTAMQLLKTRQMFVGPLQDRCAFWLVLDMKVCT